MFMDLSMYNPPEDIQELRAKGLPWVVATCLVVVFLLSAIVFYLIFTAGIISDQIATTVASPNSSQNELKRLLSNHSGSENVSREEARLESFIVDGIPKEMKTESPRPPRSISKKFLHAVVSCRNEFCAEIGRDVLIRGGNAVDAAIATAICTGAVHPHRSGFGGGMVMLVHSRATNETTVIGAYSSAPRSVTEQTFMLNPKLAKVGYSAIATPGFLHGIWTAYKQYSSGKIAWQDLLKPSVYLVERGIPISSDFAEALSSRFNEIVSEKSMSSTYNVTLTDGDIFNDVVHSDFLRRLSISRDPIETFYRGEVANQIAHEMKERGGLLTKFDLAGYEAKIERAQETALPNGYTLKGPPSPSAFSALSLLVEIMTSRYSNRSNVSVDVTYIRELLTAQRFALAKLEEIGDPEFTTDDPITNNLLLFPNDTAEVLNEVDVENLLKNTDGQSFVGSHINAIDGEGLAVSLSSSLNDKFGSVRRSPKGGFVWNNDMSAFNIIDKEDSEDEHVNAVEGRKRPRTFMTPFMLFDGRGQLVSSFGITGSLNSILAAAQVLLNQMLFNKDLASSLESPQIFANSAGAAFEIGFPANLLSQLSDELSISPLLIYDSAVHTLRVFGNSTIESVCDFRDNVDICAEGF